MQDGRDIRWGILTAGGITNTIAADLARTAGNVMVAVAARDAGRAADFARRHGIARSYGDYEQLYADPGVDVILVCSTHPFHEQQALAAISAGKAVLVEKPLALNSESARRILAAASAAGVFASEAMWMRTNPLIRTVEEIAKSGRLGTIRRVQASFGNAVHYDPSSRLIDLANGGGALLDLGVYVAAFGWLLLGPPDSVSVTGSLYPTGADATAALQWGYDDGRDAQLWCSMQTAAPNEALVIGSDGWIRVHAPFHLPPAITVHTGIEEMVLHSPVPTDQFGYSSEIAEVERCLRAGLLDSELMPHAATLGVLQILETALAELGVSYPRASERT